MRAVLLAVGSELLSVDRLDTNSLRLAAVLERHGVELVWKVAVGDDEAAIAAAIERALADAALVVVGGGLGPTADDVTREACARALGRPLTEDAELVRAIEARFAAIGRVPTTNNRRQALRIAGAQALENRRGSAPGQRIDLDGRTIFLFPGVPYELELMIESHLEPWLADGAGGRGRERRTLKVALRPESETDQRLEPLYAEFGRENVTVLASPGENRVVLLATGTEAERRVRLDAMESRAVALLGDALYGRGEEATLEAVVGALLVERELSLATAESCTGGLVAQRITGVAGASRYFPGGVVAYSNREKERLLGVSAQTLDAHGAVSAEVAIEMAQGARAAFTTDLGVAVTGIAGPDGGSAEKPVGTVHVALAAPDGAVVERRLRLPGDRERIRWQSSQAALELTRRWLMGLRAGGGR